MDRYIVARFEGLARYTGTRLQSVGDGAERPARAEPGEVKMVVETTTLTEAQRAKEARDPKQDVVQVMPTTLVKPVSSAEARSQVADAVAEARQRKSSWGIGAVGIGDDTKWSGKGVVVAVLDTGINDHAAFRNVKVVPKNFTKSGPGDKKGHGTHCASTIFGADVDGVRIGIARGIDKALVGKVLDDQDRGSTEEIIEGLKWAQSEKANIVSMSLGIDFSAMVDQLVAEKWPRKAAISRTLQAYRASVRLFDSMVAVLSFSGDDGQGMLVVAAAGNETLRGSVPSVLIDVATPASTERVLSVGAVARSGDTFAIAPFSNLNPAISAPGVDIVGADKDGGLVVMHGTSMACPHVAGLAALWWERDLLVQGRASAAEIRANLVATSAPVRGIAYEDLGRGIVKAPPPQ